jgi:molybdopterin-binding protein
MKLSTRNQLIGTVTALIEGPVNASLKIDIGGQTVTSSITDEAVKDLDLKVGDAVTVLIKSSDVMIGK